MGRNCMSLDVYHISHSKSFPDTMTTSEDCETRHPGFKFKFCNFPAEWVEVNPKHPCVSICTSALHNRTITAPTYETVLQIKQDNISKDLEQILAENNHNIDDSYNYCL